METKVQEIEEKPKHAKEGVPMYGTWVPDFLMHMLYVICFALFFMTVLVLFVFHDSAIGMVSGILTAIALIITLYFAQCRKVFSPRSGSLMSKLHHFIMDKLDWDGNGSLHDLGSGNGELAIRCAFKYPEAHITGTDWWNRPLMEWGFSRWQCEENTRVEEVADRVTFVPARNGELSIEDGAFDALVSCFYRMDTGYETGKREQLLEGFRTLRKGGKFALVGMFKHHEIYGDIESLLEDIRDLGVEDLNYQPSLLQEDFVPSFASLPFMIRKAGIIYGTK